jgi:hypothetical protein
MSARDISPEDFAGLEFQATRRWMALDDHQDPQPNTRALWAVCVGYLVVMVSVISAVKYFVTGSI